MRTFALALAFFSLAAAASAEDIHKLKRTANAYKERSVGGYFASISDTCENTKLPEIDLNIPPAGGTVCTRSGLALLHNVWGGGGPQHCIGKRMFGALVIYTPFRSFTGLDTMQYTVRGGPRPLDSRTYEVEITVEAGQQQPGGSSAPPQLQKAGPMPACPALVS